MEAIVNTQTGETLSVTTLSILWLKRQFRVPRYNADGLRTFTPGEVAEMETETARAYLLSGGWFPGMDDRYTK
jgi:hypothetical protein